MNRDLSERTRAAGGTGSGSVIESGRVLTAAHVVNDQTFVQVRPNGTAREYRAPVAFVSHVADLALVEVDDRAFHEGLAPLELGELPAVRDRVAAYGFPNGGETLSITEGVVARVEDGVYVHRWESLVEIQMDAALAPGSSGGSLLHDGRIVGVAMQGFKDSAIGCAVPAPLVRQFLADVADGRLDGIPTLGLAWQKLENPALKASLGGRTAARSSCSASRRGGGSPWTARARPPRGPRCSRGTRSRRTGRPGSPRCRRRRLLQGTRQGPSRGRASVEGTDMTTEAATAAACGLVTREGAPVPLRGVRVEARIQDYACRVVLSQRYRNDEALPIEAVYRFPLEEGTAVCGFEAVIDGRHVVGEVDERGKAFERYDEALAAGHGAYLLDQERADVFTLSVGSLPPGKEVVVRLTTVSELPLEGDAIRFTLPTTLSPRYSPAEDQVGAGESEADRVSAPWALAVPYGLELTVDVETTAPLRAVESPTHPIALALDGHRATVRLAERAASMDRDFVLKVTLAETHRPRAVVERGPDGKAYALLSFRPEFPSASGPAEVVFLVDRSGSMQGTSTAEAKNALALALRSLRPGCFFDVVGFGSTFESLFDESRPYDEDSFAKANALVEDLEADLGGTEILPALEAVLERKPRAGLPRQVFLLTDGEVSNTDAVIALVRKHAAHARVFTFGIGAGASLHLVKAVARAGGGEAELVAPGERVEAKVLRQLARALAPAVSDIAIDWGGLRVETAPHEAPAVFAGGRALVFGRIDELKPATVTLRGRTANGEVNASLDLEATDAPEGSTIATLWARRVIRDLEEGASALHGRRGSKQERAPSVEERVKAEIVRLGKAFGLVSRHTSYVAVEEREVPAEGDTVLRRVPIAVTRGWHGMDSVEDVARYSLACAAPKDVAKAIDSGPDIACIEGLGDDSSLSMALSRAPGGRTRGRRQLDRLVALQKLEGSWELTGELAGLLGRKEKELQAVMDQFFATHPGGQPSSIVQARQAFATALALAWLEHHGADTEDEWRLLARKAHEWLARMPEGAAFWLELAGEVVRP